MAALLSTAEVRVVEAAAPSAPAATQSAATAPAPTAAPQERRFGGGESTAVEKKSTAVDYRTVQQKINAPLLRLLVDLGYKKMDAVRRLDIAWKRFEGRPNLPSESELVYEAFRA